ncbi:unnamed protein product [Schistocephalus solidus]|uniref:Ca_chan_IQ domain-containing protein n=1 Tax=Schistocephalus solidus TaxID=70667 RepID=A0A183SPH0_SCHSO|nr:unnamed protein product [Schistocephalus solidus]
MLEMLRKLEPPVGFGMKCPYRFAYRKLIRMNIPVDEAGTVPFTTTLFALIRESLSIKVGPASVMDIKDAELRETLRAMWPLQAKKVANVLVPSDAELTCGHMTTGKIYAGLLIYENWIASTRSEKPSINQRKMALIPNSWEAEGAKILGKDDPTIEDSKVTSVGPVTCNPKSPKQPPYAIRIPRRYLTRNSAPSTSGVIGDGSCSFTSQTSQPPRISILTHNPNGASMRRSDTDRREGRQERWNLEVNAAADGSSQIPTTGGPLMPVKAVCLLTPKADDGNRNPRQSPFKTLSHKTSPSRRALDRYSLNDSVVHLNAPNEVPSESSRPPSPCMNFASAVTSLVQQVNLMVERERSQKFLGREAKDVDWQSILAYRAQVGLRNRSRTRFLAAATASIAARNLAKDTHAPHYRYFGNSSTNSQTSPTSLRVVSHELNEHTGTETFDGTEFTSDSPLVSANELVPQNVKTLALVLVRSSPQIANFLTPVHYVRLNRDHVHTETAQSPWATTADKAEQMRSRLRYYLPPGPPYKGIIKYQDHITLTMTINAISIRIPTSIILASIIVNFCRLYILHVLRGITGKVSTSRG